VCTQGRIYEVCSFWKRNHLTPSQYHGLNVHSAQAPKPFESGPQNKQTNKQTNKWMNNRPGLLIELEADWADHAAAGNIWRNESWLFSLLLPESQKSKAGILWFRHFLCLPVILHRWFWFRAMMPHPLEGKKPSKRPKSPILMPKYTLLLEKMRESHPLGCRSWMVHIFLWIMSPGGHWWGLSTAWPVTVVWYWKVCAGLFEKTKTLKSRVTCH